MAKDTQDNKHTQMARDGLTVQHLNEGLTVNHLQKGLTTGHLGQALGNFSVATQTTGNAPAAPAAPISTGQASAASDKK